MAKRNKPSGFDRLWDAGQKAYSVYSAVEGMAANARAHELHALQLESHAEARRTREFVEREESSGKLGGARLATVYDAQLLNMLDPNGLFLGRLDGRAIFYNGDAHLLNYGPTRSGKGRDVILPNLAHVGNRSMIVSDIKNGENAWATARHRRNALGHRNIALNPFELHGLGNFRLNPFAHIIRKAQAGEDIIIDCIEATLSLVPPMKGENKWVSEGAQGILAMWIEWAALFDPDRCTLSNLWRFVNEKHKLEDRLKTIMRCGDEALEAAAASFAMEVKKTSTQYNAYYSEMRAALISFRPDGQLGLATDVSDFDPAEMRHERMTAYLMTPENKLAGSARWVSLVVSHMLETMANEPGPVPALFMIDELANLPYMPVVTKALTLYAGLGIQLWGLCQGRNSLLARGYSKETVHLFEEQAGVFSAWNIEDVTLMGDIEKWSGMTSVAIRTVSNSDGGYGSASFGLSEQKRPLLQAEEIRSIGAGLQLIKCPGAPLFVMERVPFYEVGRWQNAVQDVRQLHSEKAPMRLEGPESREPTRLERAAARRAEYAAAEQAAKEAEAAEAKERKRTQQAAEQDAQVAEAEKQRRERAERERQEKLDQEKRFADWRAPSETVN